MLHVVVLPWVLTMLIVAHLFLMRVQGLATLERVGEEKPIDKKNGVPFFPHHVLKEGVVFSLLVGVLVTLIVLWPVELGEKADPFVTPEGIKPEWYFLSTYQLLKYFPKMLGLFVSLIPPLLLLVWPFLDRSPERHPKKAPRCGEHRRGRFGAGARLRPAGSFVRAHHHVWRSTVPHRHLWRAASATNGR